MTIEPILDETLKLRTHTIINTDGSFDQTCITKVETVSKPEETLSMIKLSVVMHSDQSELKLNLQKGINLQ